MVWSVKNALVCGLVLSACAPEQDTLTPAGAWELTLSCRDDNTEIPACMQADVLLFELEGTGPFYGSHLSFFPGYARPDGAYSGVPGPIHGDFQDDELVLVLLPDLDYPFVSDEDAEAWSDHHLTVRGRFASRCWIAQVEWLDTEGQVQLTADGQVRRLDDTCAP